MPKFYLDRYAKHLVDKARIGKPDDLLTLPEAAEAVDQSIAFMEARLREGNGPRSLLIPPRMRRYRRRDVVAWLKERAAIFEKERANA